jgi:hypothetical protein
MYGIGAGIVLAIVYWIAMVVFSGIGAAGLISPLLAAWRRTSYSAAARSISCSPSARYPTFHHRGLRGNRENFSCSKLLFASSASSVVKETVVLHFQVADFELA